MPDNRSRNKRSSKGRNRHIATAEEIESRNAQIRKPESESSEEEDELSDTHDNTEPQIENDAEDDQKEEENTFKTYNPNHNPTQADKQQLSRKAKEQISKIKFDRKLDKLMAEGKTEKSRADLARLAEVRARREAKARERQAVVQ